MKGSRALVLGPEGWLGLGPEGERGGRLGLGPEVEPGP